MALDAKSVDVDPLPRSGRPFGEFEMKYVIAMIVIACLSGDALAGCRAPVRRFVAAVVPGRVVEREAHRKVTRAPLIRRVAAPACSGPTCPAPAVAPKPKGK